MSKVKSANERVMYDYLNELLHPVLTIPETEATVKTSPEDDLKLTSSSVPKVESSDVVESKTTTLDHKSVSLETSPTAPAVEEPSIQTEVASVNVTQASVSEEPFQALFFEVAGLTMAVPLTQLGGIHNLSERNHLLGKPDWFDGVMVHREERYNVVDTARWVMPERYQQVEPGLNYQYLIMLEDSGWGLMCDRLITTEALSPDDVKWSKPNGKRAWLAGLVKEKKCALIEVSELIKLLNLGLNCNG